MNIYFVDTSALAKRYLNEVGSAWVLTWIEPPAGNVIVISQLTTVEMYSLLARRLRDGTLSLVNYTSLQADFDYHAEKEYITVPLEKPVLSKAQALLSAYPLRTLDAIQLASAIEAQTTLNVTMTFVSADTRLLAAAAGEGFSTDDPNAHP